MIEYIYKKGRKNMTNRYRIGEFSKYLGVTPEFLKHYEQYGLIPPSTSESGYRYYPFEMASEVLECIKLRNWGFSLKEIKKMIKESSMEDILEMYASKAEEMKQIICFYEAAIHDFEQLKNGIEQKYSIEDWTIEKLEDFVFLPHSNQLDFIHDDRIYSIMKQWVQWMPVVHSCQYLDAQNYPAFQWGFCIPLRLAQKYHLINEKPCRIIHAQRYLVIPFARNIEIVTEFQTNCIEIAKKIAEKHHLKIKGDIYREVFHYSHEDGKHTQYSRMIVPLD